MLLYAAEVKVNLFPFHSGSDLVSMQIVGSEVLGSTNKVFKHKAQFNSVRSGFERRKMRLEGFCMKVGDYTADYTEERVQCITIFSRGASRRQLL